MRTTTTGCVALAITLLLGCTGSEGPTGRAGASVPGKDGAPGADGKDGAQGPAGPAGKDTTTVSGSRLRARFLAGDDGARQFIGFHDVKLGADCTAFPDGLGATRCMPLPFAQATGGAYADAACTQRLYDYPVTSGPVPTYGKNTIVDPTTYAKLSATPFVGEIYTFALGPCGADSMVDPNGPIIYWIGTDVAVDAFEAFAEKIE
jgi:hypothetical protein